MLSYSGHLFWFFLLRLLPNTDSLQQVQDYVRGHSRGGFRGGVRVVRPPNIRKAYVIQR
jgi:hypothetical protein